MKTKSRLTITLSKDLLEKVDSLIDGHTNRSRSHAIENLVRQGIGSSINTAVILAGSQRDNKLIPSLKKIGDRYILSMVIDQLKNTGMTKIVICAGSNEKKIKDVFDVGVSHGVNILYSSEKKPLGSAGAIKNAEQLIGRETFLVINDSTLTDLKLEDFLEFHQNEDSIATICVKPRMSEEKYGQAFLHGNKITKFLDKTRQEGTSIVNVGLYVFKSEIFRMIEKNKYLKFETDIFPKLAQDNELSAFVFQGSWLDASREINQEKFDKKFAV